MRAIFERAVTARDRARTARDSWRGVAMPDELNPNASRRAFVGQMTAAVVLGGAGSLQLTPPDDLKERMSRIMHAWDNLDPSAAAPYYAKEPDLVFYDDSPLKYTGWDAYARGVRKEFADYTSFATTLADDVAVHRVGNAFAWGTATWRANAVKRNGSTEVVLGRWTVLFEKRDANWLIVHEHVSVPTPEE
jgi:ketosteroid isomerase-like protein